MKAFRNIIESKNFKSINYNGNMIKIGQIYTKGGVSWSIEKITRLKVVGDSEIDIELHSNTDDSISIQVVTPLRLLMLYTLQPS